MKETLKKFINLGNYYKYSSVGYTLSSGHIKNTYFDIKGASLNSDILFLITKFFYKEIEGNFCNTALAGIDVGSSILLGSLMNLAYIRGHEPRATLLRKSKKKYGLERLIENPLPSCTNIILIDDVITTGASIEECCNELKNIGNNVIKILAVIDRNIGGKEYL